MKQDLCFFFFKVFPPNVLWSAEFCSQPIPPYVLDSLRYSPASPRTSQRRERWNRHQRTPRGELPAHPLQRPSPRTPVAEGLHEQASTETNPFDAETELVDSPSKSCKARKVWGVSDEHGILPIPTKNHLAVRRIKQFLASVAE